MFPEAQDDPACLIKDAIGILVTSLVGFELGSPPLLIGLWECSMLWTTMPETTINEYSDTRLWKNHISTSAQTWDRRLVNHVN